MASKMQKHTATMLSYVISYALYFFIGLAGYAVIDAQVREWISGARWFEIQSVTVSDMIADTPPNMTVVRTIHRPFKAEWTAELEYQTPRGGWRSIQACQVTGTSNYQPDAELPDGEEAAEIRDRFTILWWFGFDLDGTGSRWAKCLSHMPPSGRFRIDTAWTIHDTSWPPKTVNAISNTFTRWPSLPVELAPPIDSP